MTDPKTLVARLRAENAMAGYYGPPALQVEAADRIEALEEALRWIKNMPLPAPPLDDPAHYMRTIATRALGDSHE